MKRVSLALAVCALVVGGVVSTKVLAQGASGPNVTYSVTFVLINDTTVKVEVDSVTYNNFNKPAYMTSLLNSPVWTLSVEDRTIIIPTANILYIETTPAIASGASVGLKGRLIQAPASK